MKKISIKSYKKKSGILIPISFKKDIPFKSKRIFIIHGKKNAVRGNHAHYKCSQFLVPLCGSMIVEYENKIGNFKEYLSLKKKKLFIIKTQNMV